MQTHNITLKARVFSNEEDELVRLALNTLVERHLDDVTTGNAKRLLGEMQESDD